MPWDLDDLARYERWLASRRGAYALAQEFRLLESLISAWPRRGRTLLEIGCGPGVFLEFFHHAGYDVTGLDKSPVMAHAARKRLGHRAEVNLGDCEALPYEDNQFDVAALLTVLEFVPDPEAALREAVRVARSAVIVGYLNRWSFYRLCAGKGSIVRRGEWFTPLGMHALARKVTGHAPAAHASVLPGPPWTWRPGFPLWGLGRMALPLPVGAYCGAVLDLTLDAPLTGLPARAFAQPS
ncbi:Malonyl-[acyl-carrier protein] O-methyltransferase [Fundidesulfovibrio magnetotacticus]|uniref:Malonyl-[acyl-carrier protein] O-methyltransferase n=1 Tax=Fundidesulfovibrio magnetotacticus TaxID=2730080 RepID=A0A6V8M4I5_9BACT|nr:class I SAM-dependent methyltransferase [Fundidesulfovibrio magnetotacticus]GFK95345.1 Malonyl-[acyl-carrier protein] O-methyltransferase [Fundidesulfovibrio magnetotacticus]